MARLSGQFGSQYGRGNIRFLTPIQSEWWSGARLTFLIIIINFAIWLAITIASKFNPGIYKIAGEYLAISPLTTFGKGKFYLWTLVTHAFTHFDFMHCFFNMLFLFFFSPQIERDFGPRKFLFYYFLTAFGAALLSMLFKITLMMRGVPPEQVPGSVGASGAVMGILIAYGMSYPNQIIYLFGMFPLRVRTLIIAIVIIQLALAFQDTSGLSCTDYWAHIGGLATGYLYMKLPGLIRKGPKPPKKQKKNWRAEDDGNERSYYLEV